MPDKEKKKSKDYFTYYWYAFSVILAYIFYKYIYLKLGKESSYGIFDWQPIFILICLINLIFGIFVLVNPGG